MKRGTKYKDLTPEEKARYDANINRYKSTEKGKAMVAATRARYMAAHGEEYKEYLRKYRSEHKEQCAEYSRKRYQTHREDMLESSRKWRERNPNYQKEWRLKHPDYQKQYRQKMKALDKNKEAE